MSNPQTKSGTSRSTVAGRLSLLGEPPVIDGEDANDFHRLLHEISEGINPIDMIEEILVYDVAILLWEGSRLRRLKVSFLRERVRSDPPEDLNSLVADEPEQLFHDWARQEPAAVQQVNELLARHGLTMDSIMATVLLENLEFIGQIDHMLTVVETRRFALLRQIDRRRSD